MFSKKSLLHSPLSHIAGLPIKCYNLSKGGISMTNRHLLVFSASIGNGHNQAAKAFITAWEKMYPQQSEFIDFVSHQTAMDRLAQWGYEFMIQHCPWAYEFMYRLSDLSWIGPFMRWQTGFFCDRRIQEWIDKSPVPPAALVFSHPTPANAASALKRKGKITIPLIGIVTDFAVHQLWQDPYLDLYIVPHEEFVQPLINQGIPPEKILPAGIPIGEAFWDINIIENNNDHNAESLEILIAGGGWGMGPLKEAFLALENLSRPCNVTVITGKNEALKNELDLYVGKSRNNLDVVGYTSEIHKYMQKAHLFITKAGGLSTSESFACGTPLLLLPGRAGQEEDNCRFFDKHGAAFHVNSIKEIPQKVEKLLQSEEFRQELTQNAINLGKPHAAQNSAKRVEELLNKANSLGA